MGEWLSVPLFFYVTGDGDRLAPSPHLITQMDNDYINCEIYICFQIYSCGGFIFAYLFLDMKH
jgi:hypothetical protein